MGLLDDILDEAGKIIKISADPLDLVKMHRSPSVSDVVWELITGSKGCSAPVPGTPVYCDLAIVAEHTGIYIGDKKISSADFGVFYFTTESAEQCATVYEAYLTGSTIPGLKTNGLFYRELL